MLIDKPAGWTSHDVVAAVRRRLGIRAVGHAGTLDPFATGLLIVLVGKATRLARFVEGMAKVYEATVEFGRATDTDDGTGTVVRRSEPTEWPTRDAISAALAGFVGERMQRPPVFSAKHVGGTRSYHLARRGEAVELAPVLVRFDRVDALDWSPPRLRLRAEVGKGTYLRALARDLGEDLGIPAHCAELRRTAIGTFSVDDAVEPESVEAVHLCSAAALLPGMPAVIVDDAAATALRYGRRVEQQTRHDGVGALLTGDGELLAVGDGRDGWWLPSVVFETPA